jgi:YHS domain-containing protein
MNSSFAFTRRSTVAGLLLVFLGLFPVFAGSAFAAEKPVNADRHGVAIKGYDPVAYFTLGAPTKGDAQFAHTWNGATWHFAKAEHRDLFAAAPEKYAPQYGGYCAWAVSNGYTAPIDPTAWKIVEGRLFLNYNASVRKTWEADEANRIRLGDTNWPQALEK